MRTLVNFYVDDINPVDWNDDAYGHLVYPEEQKDLVLTFVENHQCMKAGVDDVIMGKGKKPAVDWRATLNSEPLIASKRLWNTLSQFLGISGTLKSK